MDPRMIPKGSASEYNRDDRGQRPDNKPGVYFHPEAGKFIETANVKRSDGSTVYSQATGKIQGDAFVQLGYRPATDEELKEYRARTEENAAAQRRAESSTTVSLGSSRKK